MQVLIGKYYTQNNKRLLNGILMGTSNSKIQLSEIDGIDSAPFRNNSNNWSGKDGGYMSAQLFAAREITLQGFYYDKDYACDGNEISIREELINFLKIRTLFPLFFQTISGRVYYTEGYLTNISMPYVNTKFGEFQITFYCPDSDMKLAEQFGDEDSVIKRNIIYKDMNSGGHLVPETLPVLFQEGQQSSTLRYNGSSICYPKIILEGPFTSDITIQNYTLDKTFIIKKNIAAGSVVVIDMNNRQLLENGRSISLYMDENSEWWYLQPGYNKIYLTSGNDATDNVMCNIEWTENYQGI
jgi:phage-related protein